MRTSQGIDHALCGQSSQGPRKQHDVDALRRKDQLLETDGARIDVRKRRGQLGDRVGVGIDRDHRFGVARVPPRQAAVAAADFNHAAACERRNHRAERGDFVALRVFSDQRRLVDAQAGRKGRARRFTLALAPESPTRQAA